MLILIKFLKNVLNVLNSEASPNQVAAGFAIGGLIGLLPIKGLLPVALGIFCFFINVNLGMVTFGAAIFKIFSFVIDPVANQLGYVFLVRISALKGLWTRLYNMPVVPLTNFNNTIVMGSLVLGIILLIPLFFVGKSGVVHYRTRWKEKILRLKIVQIVKTSSLYRYYESYRSFKGE